MRVSYNWLKDFVDITAPPHELGEKLTAVGLALDALDLREGPEGGDAVFDFDVATNRPDCLSHLGIAREAAAVYGVPLRRPEFDLRETDGEAKDRFSVSIEDPLLCGRYCGRHVSGVRIGASPDWLKARLEALGVRSINNVADATNYVMLELGQPLHAFDADTLQGRQVVVRRAAPGERLTTLDGVERELNPEMLLIADGERGVAIAGVMGGAETEISLTTTNVFLESAWFDPVSIRKTSRAIGLATEASYRFERGADIEIARYACDRAAALIQTLAGGVVHRPAYDLYPGKKAPASVRLRRKRIAGFLGAPVADEIVERIFERLGFSLEQTGDGWSITAPSHRIDIACEEDLLDEIARSYGFDKFPSSLPSWNGYGSALPQESAERTLRNNLAAAGYSEIYSYSFSSEEAERRFRPHAEPVRLVNPMSEDATILRTSLAPSMLAAVLWNLHRGIRDLQLFELSKVYDARGENRSLILAACGALRSKSVHEPERAFDFYDLKGDVEQILEAFHAPLDAASDDLPPYYHPGRAARFGALAVFGELHPDCAEMFKIRHRVYLAEIDVEKLLALPQSRRMKEVPRFPAVRRDFSLLLDKATQYADLHRIMMSAGIPELVRVAPFDRLETGPFPESKYSLSISVLYQSAERTLTDAEVDGFDQRLLQILEQRLGAQLRK